MPINYTVLKADILARPELADELAVGDDVGIAKYYNTSQSGMQTNQVTVTNESVLRWSATGPYSKLYDALNSSGLVHAVRSRAAVLLRVIDFFSSIDVSSGAISGVVSNLATNGIITTTERDNFLDLAVKTSATPAEKLFGINSIVTINDVSQALRGQ